MVLPIFFLLFSFLAHSQSCPQPVNAPACPTSGSQILDETYPIQSFVISYESYNTDSSRGLALPARTMVETMRAYNFSTNNMPMIIFPASADNFQTLRTELLSVLQREGKTLEQAEALIAQRVRHVEARPWTWQQDYFEATFDPQTGSGRINFSEVYQHRAQSQTLQSFGSIVDANVCGLSAGPMLRSSYHPAFQEKKVEELRVREGMSTTPTMSAEFGGNMEGLPGGLCLVGDNMTDSFARQICGNSENMVKIEANWLEVGHVDEIMKVLPDLRATNRPRECAFTIATADTELGLSLLGTPSNLNRNVLQLDVDPSILNATSEQLENSGIYNATFRSSPSTMILCDIANDRARNKQSPRSRGNPSGVRGAFIEWLTPSAYAEAFSVDTSGGEAANCLNGYDEVNGREFLKRIEETKGLLAYNAAVQRSLVRSRQKIYDAILARLPQCRQYFSTLDDMFTKVPNIFSPQDPNESETHLINGEVGYGSNGFSFFPNPTNSVLMNNSVLFPGPVPAAYKDYLNQQTKARGLTPVHLDTWDYAHTGQGNIHCSSHSIPYCSPGGR